ncbi:MAG: oxygenase MpaB family protein [Rhizobacter sp.]
MFKNPVSVFIGGVAAVLLELAEPGVRSGVWLHSSFRERPVDRLRRTGYAAMMTVYGPRARTEAMIAGVTRRHGRVHGVAPDGRAYSATDPKLLDWVHATASFGFLEAYHRFVDPVTVRDRDRFFLEGQPAAALYGARSVPRSDAGMAALLEQMAPRLEPSEVLHEFLRIVRVMPALPPALRPVQGVLVTAAVMVLPPALRDRLDLSGAATLSPWQEALVRRAGVAMDRLVLRTHPAVQACRRLGLPDDHLYA